MIKVTIHVAKTNLSKLIAKVEAGEEVASEGSARSAAAAEPKRASSLKNVTGPIVSVRISCSQSSLSAALNAAAGPSLTPSFPYPGRFSAPRS